MLEGRNIILRLFQEEDLEEFYTLSTKIADRGDYFPISLRSLPETRKQYAETGWWEEHQGRMLICGKDGRRIGDIGFFGGQKHLAGYEVGYWVYRPDDRGRGTMTAALRIFSAYLFALKPIPRLAVLAHTDNKASRRVAEKCGYRHEGTARKQVFYRGDYADCERYALLREDCTSLAEALRA